MLANATVRSRHAAPIATPAKFCSAMKHSTNLSGNASLNLIEYVEFLTSPSRATTCELFCPTLTKAVPYANLVAT